MSTLPEKSFSISKKVSPAKKEKGILQRIFLEGVPPERSGGGRRRVEGITTNANAYGEVSHHHVLRAASVSRFATGRKFGFHHIGGASQNKRQNLGRLRRQGAENPRGFSRGFATKPEARDPAKAGSNDLRTFCTFVQ
jgi:hypothetical protein